MKILIQGLAKSGTTALTFKIFNSLPVEKTTLLFEEPAYIPNQTEHTVAKVILNGYLNDTYRDSQPHESSAFSTYDGFDKRILIVRDPRDRLISSTLFSYHRAFWEDELLVFSFLNILKAKEQVPDRVPFLDVFSLVNNWRAYAKAITPLSRVKRCAPGRMLETDLLAFERDRNNYFLLYYEDFIDNKIAALEDYLGLKLIGDPVVRESLKYVERTKSYGDYRNWFTDSDKDCFSPLLRDFFEQHTRYSEWFSAAERSIPAAHASDFVRRWINRQRIKAGLLPIR